MWCVSRRAMFLCGTRGGCGEFPIPWKTRKKEKKGSFASCGKRPNVPNKQGLNKLKKLVGIAMCGRNGTRDNVVISRGRLFVKI